MSAVLPNAGELVRGLVTPGCVVDPESRILAANDEFLELAGLHDLDTADNPTIGSILSLSEEFPRLVASCLSQGRSFKIRRMPVRAHADRRLMLDISGLPASFDGRSGPACVLLFADRSGQPLARPDAVLSYINDNDVFAKKADPADIMIPAQEGASEDRLKKAYADMNEELEMARNIQEGLMPGKLPDAINLKSAALYIPAGKVGGDLYDMIITPSQKVAVLIFDVSGHGIPAALIGAMAKMLFTHYLDKSESPAQVFTEVNKRICKFIKSEHYITAFLGIIDPLENTMVYSKAGHVPPLLWHAKTREVSQISARGFFIGHMALSGLAEYGDETIRLEPGDKLLFYTDGLTEGTNPANEMYGMDRLTQAMRQSAGKSPERLLEALLDDQTSFRQGCPLRDDFTMLGVEIGNPDSFLEQSGFGRSDHPNLLVVYTYKSIEEAAGVILREMDRNGFPDKDIKRTKVCIYEMLANAIEHGNTGDETKKTLVAYKVTPEKAAISVIDEGMGFDYSRLPDPLTPENLLKDHGRGLFIIRRYMDQIHFNTRGNRIMAVKFHREKTEGKTGRISKAAGNS